MSRDVARMTAEAISELLNTLGGLSAAEPPAIRGRRKGVVSALKRGCTALRDIERAGEGATSDLDESLRLIDVACAAVGTDEQAPAAGAAFKVLTGLLGELARGPELLVTPSAASRRQRTGKRKKP